MTQEEASYFLGIPKRTLENYEDGQRVPPDWVYDLILDRLAEYELLAAQRHDLTHGIYTLSQIRLLSFPVFKKNPVRKAILFGSYAKGLVTPTSELDLVIDTDQKGLAFFAIADELEQVFHKKVDLFRLDQLEKGGTAEKEVVKTGLRIFAER